MLPGNAAASAQLDSHEEHDLGAFDAVSALPSTTVCTAAELQSTAVIYAKDGSYTVFPLVGGDGKTIYLAVAPPWAGTGAPLPRRRLHRADGSL